MTPEENKSIALRWFDAFNEHDIHKLLALYADDALHFSPKLKIRQPETQGFVKGQKALFDWWSGAFERIPSLKYIVETLTADNERVFMEYLRKADGEEDMKVAEVLEIRNGKIVASRVYHG